MVAPTKAEEWVAPKKARRASETTCLRVDHMGRHEDRRLSISGIIKIVQAEWKKVVSAVMHEENSTERRASGSGQQPATRPEIVPEVEGVVCLRFRRTTGDRADSEQSMEALDYKVEYCKRRPYPRVQPKQDQKINSA